jgi:hypothetical protein
MAKASLAATIDAIHGHVGSLQFWLGQASQVVGTTNNPRATLTPRQRAAQAAWSAMVKAWSQSLTPADKETWANFGTTFPGNTKCGGTAHLNPWQAFTRSNRAILHANKPLLTSAPSSFVSPSPGTCTLTYAPGPPHSLMLAYTTAPSAQQVPIIRASGPTYPGVTNTNNRTVTLAVLTAGETGPYQIAQQWELRFGTIKTGQKIHTTLVYVDFTSGAVSTKSPASLIIP